MKTREIFYKFFVAQQVLSTIIEKGYKEENSGTHLIISKISHLGTFYMLVCYFSQSVTLRHMLVNGHKGDGQFK
jgi:hypothetical protein